jgi:hypothetical protein
MQMASRAQQCMPLDVSQIFMEAHLRRLYPRQLSIDQVVDCIVFVALHRCARLALGLAPPSYLCDKAVSFFHRRADVPLALPLLAEGQGPRAPAG